MVAVGNIHNTRLLRFLIVIIAVLLTIFIYASYSTTSQIMPQHMRIVQPLPPATLQLLQQQQQQLQLQQNRSHEMHLGGGDDDVQHGFGVQLLEIDSPSSSKPLTGNHLQQQQQQPQQKQQQQQQQSQQIKTSAEPSGMQHTVKKQQQHRVPTIDADALNDGGNGGADNTQPSNVELNDLPDEMGQLVGANDIEEQYAQNVENLMGNINNNTDAAIAARQQQQQQQPGDAEILIPTLNMQKFIENADKILKNISSNNGSSSNTSPAAASAPLLPKQQTLDSKQNDKVVAQQPSQKVPQFAEQPQEESQDQPQPSSNDQSPLPLSVIMHIAGAGSANKESDGEVGADAASAVKPKTPDMPKVVANKLAKEKPSPKGNKKITPVDPSKGIPTEQIYESGHLNDQIDIENICPNNGKDLKLLILIMSAPTHVEARLAIRQTWAHYGIRRDVSTAFVLGRTTNETINKALTQENFIYGDLIRGNFLDTYNNLTLKTVSLLEWVDQHCSMTKFLLKTDDDMFINVPKLLIFLDKHKDKRVIYGRLAKKWKPIRNKKSKYFVSTEQFPAQLFPAFTTGPAYVMTSDIVHELYEQALNSVYLKLEDVFTTGIVAQTLGIKRVHVNEFLNRRISFNPCNIRNAISVHMIKSNEQFDLWKKLLDQNTKCK